MEKKANHFDECEASDEYYNVPNHAKHFDASEERTTYYNVNNNVHEQMKDFQGGRRHLDPPKLRLNLLLITRSFKRKWLFISIAIVISVIVIAIIIGTIVIILKKRDTSTMQAGNLTQVI